MIRIRPLLVVAALLCAAGLGNAATADAAELFYGVDTQNRLVTFNGDTPTAITRIPFTGLPAGEQIVGLDVRPANKQVVALSSASRLYRIDVATGAATMIGAAPVRVGACRRILRVRLQPDGRPDPLDVGSASEPAAASRYRGDGRGGRHADLCRR